MNQEILNFSQVHAEPAWLQDFRQFADEKFNSLPLPFIERVKFDRWKLDAAQLTETDEAGAVPDFTALENVPMIVQVGTQTVFEQMPAELADKGVVFTDFWTALETHEEVIKKYLSKAVSADEDKLSALNLSKFNSGLVLIVPDNVELDLPLESIFETTENDLIKHVLVVAGKHSKLTYIERLKTPERLADKKLIANLIVEVIAEEGAQVKFAALDQLGKNVNGFVSRRGHLADNATIDWALAVMNDGNVVADFDSDLIGNGSHAELKAVGISTGKQVQGIDTRVTNFGKNSIGHIQQSGVILDAGTLTFNGIGHIISGATGADAQQSSKVLMLSDSARGDANPILLIDENDVTAGHAASVGQIDAEDLFYLQSRGLEEEEAKKLVIRGFLGSVVAGIPVKSVRDEFIKAIDGKLGI